MRKKLLFAIPIMAALLWGATSGNIQWTQLASSARHGTQAKGQSSDGTGASGNCAEFNADGSITDSGAGCGTGSGSVTSVATSSPLTGGPITTTGTIACGTCMINPMTTQGDLIYGGASGAPTRLAAGTSGYVLSTLGSGSAPQWIPASGSTGALAQLGQCLPSSASSCIFSGISGAYTNLILTFSARSAATGGPQYQDNLFLEFNTDTTADYAYQYLFDSSSTVTAGNTGSQTGILLGWACGSGCQAGVGNSGVVDIPGYAGGFFKTALARSLGNTGSSYANTIQIRTAGWWDNTAAITAIKVYTGSGTNFSTSPQTVITLYGQL